MLQYQYNTQLSYIFLETGWSFVLKHKWTDEDRWTQVTKSFIKLDEQFACKRTRSKQIFNKGLDNIDNISLHPKFHTKHMW